MRLTAEPTPINTLDLAGDSDHKGCDGLWRSFLDRDFRDLVERFDPATLVEVAQEYA